MEIYSYFTGQNGAKCAKCEMKERRRPTKAREWSEWDFVEKKESVKMSVKLTDSFKRGGIKCYTEN